jgi:hypothetical protein
MPQLNSKFLTIMKNPYSHEAGSRRKCTNPIQLKSNELKYENPLEKVKRSLIIR